MPYNAVALFFISPGDEKAICIASLWNHWYFVGSQSLARLLRDELIENVDFEMLSLWRREKWSKCAIFFVALEER